jgi:RNA polymerase sigma-70 factor (ECF subfamily)
MDLMPVADESATIKRVLAGDRTAFREIVDQHRTMVYRLAYRMVGNPEEAEDLSQEVFIRAYRSLGDFRQESKLSSWLYRITVNVCLDHQMRTESSPLPLEAIHTLDATSVEEDPTRIATSSIIQGHVRRALDSLSPRERAVFVLRHYQDLPLREVADMLSIRTGTVKALLYRAVQKMQRALSFYRKDI